MKTICRFAIALAISGMYAADAQAQTGQPAGYPSTGRYAPSLLPLPATQPSWRSAPAELSAVPQQSPPAQVVRPVAYPEYATPTYHSVASARGLDVPESVVAPEGSSVARPLPPTSDLSEAINSDGAYPDVASGDCAGDCGVDLGCCQPRWFGYAGGLVMTRDRPNKTWTTYETGNNPNQLMYFPDADWTGGAEVRFGRVFGGGGGCGGGGGSCSSCDSCGPSCNDDLCAIEVVYWGLWGLDGTDSRYSPTNQLSTPIDLGFVDIVGPGSPASLIFDNAREHRVTRKDDVNNLEINLIHFNMPTACDSVQIQWLAGFRFFKFDDFIQFGAVSGGNEFGSNGGINEAYLDVDVENNLYGFQVGGRADWRFAPRWRLFAAPKFGLYGNDINLNTQLYRGDGALATFASTGNQFNLNNDKVDVAFIGQIDIGTTWDISQRWSATIGYRAMACSGIALADDQVPAYLAAENDWTDIESSGSLILHGGFAGLEYRW